MTAPVPTILPITVTEIGEFISHKSCERRFKLGFNKRAEARRVPFAERLFNQLDPVLQEEGKRREELWEESLRSSGYQNLFHGRPRDDGEGPDWRAFCDEATRLLPGRNVYARELGISGTLGSFEVRGRIDFAIVTWVEDTPVLRLVECKASRRDRTYQRIQVATYRLLVQSQSAGVTIAGLPLGAVTLEAVVARIDDETDECQPILDLPALDLSQEDADLERLLATDGTLARIVETDLDHIEYQLDGKCDACVFSVHCFPESARLRRLELIGVEPAVARTLRSAHVQTIDDLARLDLTGPEAGAVRATAGFNASLAALKSRAHARRATLPGERDPDTYQVEPLPNYPASQLPAHEVSGDRLVRVYLTVHYDYVENRIGAISAHVTNSDGQLDAEWGDQEGSFRPIPRLRERAKLGENPTSGMSIYGDITQSASGRDVHGYKSSPWVGRYEEDTAAEREILQTFFHELVNTIADVAADREARIHFYVWSRQEIARLVEGCSRVGSGLLTHLRELLGCRQPLDQLIFSCLEDEVYNRYALGWTGRGLSVASSLTWFGRRYHWNRIIAGQETALDHVFTQDVFDFKTELELNADNQWAQRGSGRRHKFEIRSRFHDTLTAPYWRALWRRLPDPNTVRDGKLANAIRRYRQAAEPGVFRAYLIERSHALRWIEDAILFKNRDIPKPSLSVRDLVQFQLGVNTTAQAAIDFMRLDQHVQFTDWVAAHLVPPAYRLPRGRTLPLSNITCASPNVLTARIDLDGYDLTVDSLQGICTIQEGSFVRFTPCDADKARGQTVNQLLRLGSTCIVTQLDWTGGVVTLEVVPNRQADLYRLSSITYTNIGQQWPFGTLDESPTDFVGGRVERRLQVLGGHQVCTWLDPTNPQIPSARQIDESALSRLQELVRSVRLPNGRTLAPEQAECAIAGLGTRIQLLQGPPGTGKTVTTAASTLLRVAARLSAGQVVLVAANTHTAVNNLLDRIVQFLPSFEAEARRLDIAFPTVRVAKLSPSTTAEPPQEPMQLLDASNVGVRVIQALCNAAVPVIGCTTGSLLKLAAKLDSAAAFGRRPGGFQAALLVVDEASMMVFPEFLALATALSPNGELMLTGDHRQLAPIVAHDWEREERPPIVLYQPYASAYNAVRNLAVNGGVGPESVKLSALRYSFRLPALIREVISKLYRRDDIVLDGRPQEDRSPTIATDVWARIWEDRGGLFLVVHDERSSTHSNEIEAEIIRAILYAGGSLPADSVAIVTPHRAQRNLLYSELADATGAGKPVGIIDTVERLQGGERPTIFVSATESDPASIAARAEFILSLNRANVAFTRAEQRLVVVCARSLLDHIPAEIENYDATMLWKSLRAFCSNVVGTGVVGSYQATVYSPPRDVINEPQVAGDCAGIAP